MTTGQGTVTTDPRVRERPPMWKFFVYSAVGAFMFFVPITVNGASSIPLDHLVTWIRDAVPGALPYFALAMLVAGAAYPFVSGTWKNSVVSKIFSVMKIFGMVLQPGLQGRALPFALLVF